MTDTEGAKQGRAAMGAARRSSRATGSARLGEADPQRVPVRRVPPIRRTGALLGSDGERAVETLIKYAGLPTPEREFQFHPERQWRFDFAWPLRFLALEVDGGTWTGGRHTRGDGYERDVEKLNEAVLLGWRVLRVTTAMVDDQRVVRLLERALR